MMVTETQREWLDWLTGNADGRGECDRCHHDELPLWHLPSELDDETEAGWLYCAQCFRAIVKRG